MAGLKGDSLNSAEEYRRILLRYYEKSPLGEGYLLIDGSDSSVSYDEKRTVWVLLEQAGYDVKNAEYKKDRGSIRPVILSFSVVPGTGELEDVQISQTSGYSDLDAAVKYGFQASSYYNSADRKIKGRFTYRFD